jgi:peptidoglycan/xylan/chitin deacetylase (PgdA/CDA1 family)
VLRPVLRVLSPPGRSARLSILIFHRVLAQRDPLFPDELDAARFDAVCGWVRAWFNVLPLDQAVRDLRAGTLPERALAITFDDGYADNHEQALPILLRHGLPATFFIASGYLDGGRMWNDTVIEAVRRSTRPSLALDELGLAADAPMPLDSDASRRRAIDVAIRALMYRPREQRAALADELARCAGVAPAEAPMMRSSQVAALHRAGMQIGAHTVSHPILAQLDEPAARAEIAAGKQALERLIGAQVGLFAYPHGRPDADYSAASVALVREAGFEAAVSTAWGAADAANDPFQLPRFTPWDRSRWRFGARLAGNLWASRRRAPRTVSALARTERAPAL